MASLFMSAVYLHVMSTDNMNSARCGLDFCRVMNIESARHEQDFRQGVDGYEMLEIDQELPTFESELSTSKSIEVADKLTTFRKHAKSHQVARIGPRSLQEINRLRRAFLAIQHVRIQRSPQLLTTRKVPCECWIAVEPQTIQKGFAEVIQVRSLV